MSTYKTSILSLCASLVLCCSALGQLRVQPREAYQLQNVEEVATFGDIILFNQTSEKMRVVPVAAIRVETEAANVTIDVSDDRRMPVPYIEIQKNVFLVNTPGTHWVDVTAMTIQQQHPAKNT